MSPIQRAILSPLLAESGGDHPWPPVIAGGHVAVGHIAVKDRRFADRFGVHRRIRRDGFGVRIHRVIDVRLARVVSGQVRSGRWIGVNGWYRRNGMPDGACTGGS